MTSPPSPPHLVSRRILHVIEPAAFGGAETVASALARGAAARGHAVHVVALNQGAGVRENGFVATLRQSPVDVTVLRCGRRRYLEEARRLAALIGAWRADVVHTHGYHGDLVGYLAARRARAPVVATAHGFTAGPIRNRLYEWLDKQALRRMAATICVSQRLVDDLRRAGVPGDRIHLVPNGHDGTPAVSRAAARRALELTEEATLVGWIGRLSREKAPDRFVRVMRGISGAQGLIVGDGPERQSVAELVDALRAPVRLVGAHPNAGRLVRAFDVLVVSSRTEGLPMIVLDAMAGGVPVVATRVGAVPQALQGDAGWVVEEPDEGALAAALQSALDDPGERARRAARALERLAENYSLSVWLDRIDTVYEAVSA